MSDLILDEDEIVMPKGITGLETAAATTTTTTSSSTGSADAVDDAQSSIKTKEDRLREIQKRLVCNHQLPLALLNPLANARHRSVLRESSIDHRSIPINTHFIFASRTLGRSLSDIADLFLWPQNVSRKVLREEVKAEEIRIREGPAAARQKRQEEWETREKSRQQDAAAAGIDLKRVRNRDRTVEEADEEEVARRKRQKRGKVHAWSAYNQEASYASYKKRLAALPSDDLYQQQKVCLLLLLFRLLLC
jgi:hypothetical protein